MITDLQRIVASKAIEERLKQITLLYKECEALADANDVQFYDPGRFYGNGSTYRPHPHEETAEDFNSSTENNIEETGWVGSNQQC